MIDASTEGGGSIWIGVANTSLESALNPKRSVVDPWIASQNSVNLKDYFEIKDYFVLIVKRICQWCGELWYDAYEIPQSLAHT